MDLAGGERSRPSPDAFGLVVVPGVGAPYRSPVAVSAEGSVVHFFDRASDTANSDFMGQDRTDLAESMLRRDLNLGANSRTRIVVFRHTPRKMSAGAGLGRKRSWGFQATCIRPLRFVLPVMLAPTPDRCGTILTRWPDSFWICEARGGWASHGECRK